MKETDNFHFLPVILDIFDIKNITRTLNQVYSINWLLNQYDSGKSLKFLFFWGHTNNLNEAFGKFCFSQWFELPFMVNGIEYLTAEHWMMANKALLFNDITIHNKIIKAKKPGEVKELGRQISSFDEMIWADNRFEVVKTGNIHKFNQHIQFADYLLKTGDRVLVEASPVDKIWGIGLGADHTYIDNPYYWDGLNLLGFALMEARDHLARFGHFKYQENDLLPWKAYPEIDASDMFWRMGKGEDIILNFSKYYSSLSERDQMTLKLSNPTPYIWKNFYV